MEKEVLLKKFIHSCNKVDKDEAVSIICEILKLTKTEWFVKSNIGDEECEKIMNIANKLNDGYPLAKILNRAYFYGYDFYVNNDVLTPRQDSEILVFLANKIIKEDFKAKEKIKILDICSGSGCLGLTIKKISKKDIDLSLVDISEKALDVCKINSNNLGVNATFILSDMFACVNGEYDLIVSNPPYIRTCELVNLEKEVIDFDPIIALDGHNDGLYFYKQLANCVKYLTCNGVLICEIGYDQGEDVKALLEKSFNSVSVFKDNGGNDRVVVAKDKK